MRTVLFVLKSLLALAVLAGLTTVPALARTTLTQTLAQHRLAMASSGVTYHLDYWSNGEVGNPEPGVDRVVVMVHGDSRNPEDYARYTTSAASAAGVVGSTLVVAPWFVADDDGPRADQLFWTDASWKYGGTSETTGRAWAASSFVVMDRLVAALRADYPSARLVVAGHSAGGQFVQRYAASLGGAGVDQFVPINPGTYAYVDPRRWVRGALRTLTSKQRNKCSGYDTYKYGLVDAPTTLFAGDRSAVLAHYLATPVAYLLGDADTLRDSSLDTGCEADWEGATRYERGTRFFAALTAVAGPRLQHRLVTVPGVGHLGGTMIRSPQAAPLLFG